MTKFRETVEALRTLETESTTAKQTLVTREQDLKTCVDRNTQLTKLNTEILSRFDKRSAWSGVARAEPFTRIAKIRQENVIDDYKARAEDLRVPPLTAATPGAPQ